MWFICFFFSRIFFFFQGESSTKLPAARKKFTSEVPGSDVSTSNRVVASSGSGEMVGREVADNDEFTQTGNEEVIPSTAGREEPTRAAISNEPGDLPFGGIAPESVRFQDGLIMYRDGNALDSSLPAVGNSQKPESAGEFLRKV